MNKDIKNNGKLKEKLTLNIGAFYDNKVEFAPTAEKYDFNKVAFGLWDFRIKFSPIPGRKPFGYFIGVYRNGFTAFLSHHGYYKRLRPHGGYFFLRCVDNKIQEVEPIHISDFVSTHLISRGSDISFEMDVNGDSVPFIASLLLQQETIKRQCNSIFNKNFLELLPNLDTEILKDTADTCFKLFRNGVLKITKDGFELIDYKDLGDKCVWKKHIRDFEFEYTADFNDCHYYKFIENVSDAKKDEERHKSFRTAIGYMVHNFNAPERGQAVLLYDEVITDTKRPQGGTGKGLFAQGLAMLSELIVVDGKKFDENQRFSFQRVTQSTQIIFIDDVRPKLGFDRFNSLLTDGLTIERKNKDEVYISPKETPGLLLSSNSILDCEGSTRKRRQFPLEFTNFYSKLISKGNEQPIIEHHGCIFFSSDWDVKEWQKFYSFMITCVCEFLKDGLCHYSPKNVTTNRLRQITNDDFAEWVEEQKFEMSMVYETKPLYEDYKARFYPDEVFSQRRFTSFLKKYSSVNDYVFKQPKPSSGVTFFVFEK